MIDIYSILVKQDYFYEIVRKKLLEEKQNFYNIVREKIFSKYDIEKFYFLYDENEKLIDFYFNLEEAERILNIYFKFGKIVEITNEKIITHY